MLAYAADPARLGACIFFAYLSAGLCELKGLKGGVRADAEQHQRRLVTQRHDELQALLRDAARSDSLPWCKNARLANFVEENFVPLRPHLIDLDEDLPGDDEFNPIDCACRHVVGVYSSTCAGEMGFASKEGNVFFCSGSRAIVT